MRSFALSKGLGCIAGALTLAFVLLLGGCPGPKTKTTRKTAAPPVRKDETKPIPSVPTVEKTLVKKSFKLSEKNAEEKPILSILEKELRRNYDKLRAPESQKPYFIGYTVDDVESVNIRATLGSLDVDQIGQTRQLTIDMRVGERKFDNTRFLERNWGSSGGTLPLEDDEKAIRTAVWLASDRIYRQATREFDRVKAKFKTTSKEEDDSADFSEPVKTVYIQEPIELKINVDKWKERLREVSNVFRKDPKIRNSWASLRAWTNTRYFVSSEGSRLQLPTIRYQITVYASTDTEDGMEFNRHEAVYADKEDDLPGAQKLRKLAEKVRDDLMDLRNAPLAHPYEGPAIFHGKAAAVFFHEVFGHRMEGHRQKLRRFDQTFTKKIGKQVMPSFLSIYDNPLLYSINSTFLNGHYLIDDEAVKAEKVNLVENGVLKGFLMSRIPIKSHLKSNGHGRRSAGMMAVARQGNLVVDSEKVVDYEDLKKLLIAEVKKQNKRYGLLFKEVSGGLTFVQRRMPQAFKIHPVMVYRIYADGRPDELVRGVDLVGTPLSALTKIVASANDFNVFNGICGAESGWVPVSATAPSLLLNKIETQRKPVQGRKQPILPPPDPNNKKQQDKKVDDSVSEGSAER